MATQHPAPGPNERLESHSSSQSASAYQHLHCCEHHYFLDRVQPPHMSLTDPAQHSWDVDGLGVGNDSIPLPQDKQDEPRVAEPPPSSPQPTHHEQQWSVAFYPSPNVPSKQPQTHVTPIPSPIPYNHRSKQEPTAPPHPTSPAYFAPPSHSQLLQLAAATTVASVAPVPAITRPPLQVPYPGKVCSICRTNSVWKKTADRCFGCCGNKAGPERSAAVIERAARGVDSCSTCYGEADRGDNKLCTVCYGRQKGKIQRHKAKQRARKAREAAEAIFKGLGIAFDPAGQPQAVALEPAVEFLGGVNPSVQMPDMETPGIPARTI